MSEKALKHRFFWTWDHSMDWDPTAYGRQEHGCSNYYFKSGDSFLIDYKKLVDFAAKENYTGVILYGFLRDAHGKIEAAQELCKYGNDKGVRIIPGVGINSYGGIYWEGNHEFNLPTWLDKHPELELVGQWKHILPCLRMACPSQPENQEWHKRAIAWLSDTFEIGGINYETGDYGVCQCDLCKDNSERDGVFSHDDMAKQLPPLVEIAEKTRPGILNICECYFDNILDPEKHAAMKALPSSAILQFCINRKYWPKLTEGITPEIVSQLPPHDKVIRTHMGSQWNSERHVFAARTFMQLAKLASANGFDGTTIFGEMPERSALHEINYLAMSRTGDNPDLEWGEFVSEHLGPLYGEAELAAKFVALIETREYSAGDLADAKRTLAGAEEPAYERWLWMVDRIYRHLGAK
ncbi:MAG: hypothetical protein QF662_01885 [Phycisphaerae bacterium]|nr:hypothetical protein [Phycisphaerae bacterium]